MNEDIVRPLLTSDYMQNIEFTVKNDWFFNKFVEINEAYGVNMLGFDTDGPAFWGWPNSQPMFLGWIPAIFLIIYFLSASMWLPRLVLGMKRWEK